MLEHLPAEYARATLPIAPGAITTDTDGLDSGEASVLSDGFELPLYYARAERSASSPIMLVVQEIFGVHEYIRDICRRLAQEGYFAIAPELYARQGDPSQIADMQELIAKIVSRVPDAQVLRDLDAALGFAAATGKGDRDRLAICGFCWGGRISWLYAAHQPLVKAGAAWYGKLTAGPYSKPDLQPQQPVDVAGELYGAVIGLYGGRDEGIPAADVERMREAIAAGGLPARSEIVVYPEAGHAFHADYRPSYHAPSARDAWSRMLTWFRRYGIE